MRNLIASIGSDGGIGSCSPSYNESYKAEFALIVDCQNHSVFTAADVEYNPGTLEEAGRPELRFDLLRCVIGGLFQKKSRFSNAWFTPISFWRQI